MSENIDSVALESQTTGVKVTRNSSRKGRKPGPNKKPGPKRAKTTLKSATNSAKNARKSDTAKVTPEKVAKVVVKSAEKVVQKPEIYPGIAALTVGNNWGLPEEEVETPINPEKVQKLPTNVKQFIVCYLACGCTPTEVAAAVKESFGIVIKATNVARYHPMRAQGVTLSPELKQLFRTMQREHQAMIVKAGVSDKRYRMQIIQSIVNTQMDRGNHPLVLKALEQAAKEEGGNYTNKSTLQVEDKRALMAQLLQCRPEDIPTLQKSAADNRETVGSTKRW